MLKDYKDLVLIKFDKPRCGCENKTYLFQAPKWSYLQEGDKVIAQGQLATVIDSKTLSEDTDEYRFWTKFAGVTLPLAKLDGVLKPFEYEEEESNEDGQEH